MEFEDRSDRKTKATLVIMSEIDIRASDLPSPGDMKELIEKVGGMVDSLRNAKGSCWHVEDVTTGGFPPGEMDKPFEMLVKMHNIIGTTAIWAATMSQIFQPLCELRDMAMHLSGTAKELSTYLKDMATARSKSEQLTKHCEECIQCKQFFDRFEAEAAQFLEAQKGKDASDKVEEILARAKEGGCN